MYNLFIWSGSPVKIVVGQKDKFCHGCTVGDHCSKKTGAHGDEKALKRFRKANKRLPLSGEILVVKDRVTFSDAKPMKVKSILTTAGTVKRIIKSGHF